jgi:SAM-dependent methyltransferase
VLETTSCTVCNSAQYFPFATSRDFLETKEEFTIVKCAFCGAVFTNPRVPEREIGKYYPPEYGPYAEAPDNRVIGLVKRLLGRLYATHFRRVERVLLRSRVRRVLELGPGNGALLQSLQKAGFDVTGIDTDARCVDRMRAKGIACHHGSLEDTEHLLGTYDAVIMCHVLEHLYDPSGVLHTLHSHLRDGGVLYLTVPNIASVEARLFGKYWIGLDVPRHITHFDLSSLTRLLAEAGFRIRTADNLPFPSSFVESIGLVAMKGGHMPTQIYYPLYYAWKLLGPIHRSLFGSGILELVADKT